MPIRWTSSATLLEYPLVSIALGPDPSKSELRGHARAIIAIGDIATGVIAPGGVARAAVALGGLAIGGIVLGGCGIGILALAGLAGCRRVAKSAGASLDYVLRKGWPLLTPLPAPSPSSLLPKKLPPRRDLSTVSARSRLPAVPPTLQKLGTSIRPEMPAGWIA